MLPVPDVLLLPPTKSGLVITFAAGPWGNTTFCVLGSIFINGGCDDTTELPLGRWLCWTIPKKSSFDWYRYGREKRAAFES